MLVCVSCLNVSTRHPRCRSVAELILGDVSPSRVTQLSLTLRICPIPGSSYQLPYARRRWCGQSFLLLTSKSSSLRVFSATRTTFWAVGRSLRTLRALRYERDTLVAAAPCVCPLNSPHRLDYGATKTQKRSWAVRDRGLAVWSMRCSVLDAEMVSILRDCFGMRS